MRNKLTGPFSVMNGLLMRDGATARMQMLPSESRDALNGLLAACKAALPLAWEVGCETEDGYKTLLDDSRGDLWRQLTAAISKAEGRS